LAAGEKMTIDERLEKLAERHEALTGTVELIAREMHDLRSFTQEIAEGTARLLHIVQIPENRISKLEGGQ
jgi:archaellum component FlaC